MYVSPLANGFPFRIEHPESSAGGSALWSRFPLTEIAAPPALYQSTAALVDVAWAALRCTWSTHRTRSTTYGTGSPSSTASLRCTEPDGRPAIVVGDLNATYWHPPFRRIQAAGWRDAHHVAGRALSSSWPDDKAWLPPIMRLDHALSTTRWSSLDVDDVELPGSDHRGFVVTVAVNPTAQAARAARSRPLPEATGGSRTASSPPRERPDRTPSPESTVGSPSPPPGR